jgi:hypothetical protein
MNPAQVRVAVSIEELVIEKLRALAPDQKKEVQDFVEFLQEKKAPKQPLQSLHALWADPGVEISERDIAQARREMWGTFPRESF